MYIVIYMYIPELKLTRNLSQTPLPPFCSRAKARFVHLLPPRSPILDSLCREQWSTGGGVGEGLESEEARQEL